MKVPQGMNITDAGGLRKFHFEQLMLLKYPLPLFVAEIFLTAYQAIALNGRLQNKEAILIHAVSCFTVVILTDLNYFSVKHCTPKLSASLQLTL